MMDLHSTQALLTLARSGNFLGQPPVTSASNNSSPAFNPSPPTSSEANKKRPLVSTEALDLSPPTSVNKKAKIEVRNLPSNNQTTTQSGAADPGILNWSVSEVCNFVSSIDICREYAEVSFFHYMHKNVRFWVTLY